MSIILRRQETIIESLIQNTDLLDRIIEKIKKDEVLSNRDERTIMSIMAQEYHFSSLRDGIGVKELKEVFSYTDDTLRKKLRALHEKGLIFKVKGNPVKYTLSRDYLEN